VVVVVVVVSRTALVFAIAAGFSGSPLRRPKKSMYACHRHRHVFFHLLV